MLSIQLSWKINDEQGLSGETVPDHLSRLQMLFSTLLPPMSASTPSHDAKLASTSHLLRFGVPVVESQFEPGVDIVKPGMRLGLLLVGS